jgi:hypothetical protein
MFEHSTSSVYDTRNTQRSKRNSYDAAQAPSHPHVMSLHNLIRGKLVNHDEKAPRALQTRHQVSSLHQRWRSLQR